MRYSGRLLWLLWLLGTVLLTACAPFGAPTLSTNSTSSSLNPPSGSVGSATATFLATPRSTTAVSTSVENLATPVPGAIEKYSDISYASVKNVDARSLSLDIYANRNSAKNRHRPVLIYIHGGSWSSGDKSEVGHKPEFFTQAGYLFVSANYRLCPKVVFPAHAEDVAAAVAWVVRHIVDYGGDPNQIYLMGHSAGGHLVALVASDERYLRHEGLELGVIKAVIPLDSGAYDLARFASKCGSKLPDPYGATFGQNPADWNAASPVTYISKTTSIPPMAVVYSGDVGLGSSVPRSEIAGDFVKALRAAGKRADLIGAPEKNHSQVNDDFGKAGDAVSIAVLNFMQSVMTNQ
jgi:arylformamidase